MRTCGFRSASLRWKSLLFISALLSTASFAAETPLPAVVRTEFKYQPSDLQYFADSETILVTDDQGFGYGALWISKDEGRTWKMVPEIEDASIVKVYMSPHHNKVAIAAGADKKHWITRDQGATWSSYTTTYHPNILAGAFSFHALDSDRVIMNVRDMGSSEGGERTIYTKDGFKTHEVLRERTVRCLWAKEQPQFGADAGSKINDRALCVVPGRYSTKQEDWRLVMSDDFFDQDEREAELEHERAVTGIASMVAVKGYILAARNSEGTDEMALYVTTDTETWSRAQFGQHKLKEGGYTIMESTNHSLQVDVLDPDSRPSASMGILFTSNSAGQYFTQNEMHTNRNQYGFVDFEKVSSIEGIVITNVVSNFDRVRDSGVAKKLISRISFDDGRTFESMKADGLPLHLHSITDQRNAGRVFSSPAPGLLMGVGNTGEDLLEYNDGDLYVSETAGLTWRRALPGAHKYEFGDSGSILLAMYDEGEIGEMIFSLNHGKDWQKILFEKDYELPGVVRPQLLSTTPDSTSLKFVMVGTTGREREMKRWIYHIDFSKLDLAKCKSDDFETWEFKQDPEGKPTCVMGTTQSFRRRKANANCFIAEEFKDPQPIKDSTKCPCQEKDFECKFGFVRSEDRSECVPLGKHTVPEGQCKNPTDEFDADSGFQLIPGNKCNDKDGVDKAKTIKRPCSESSGGSKPATGRITNEIVRFPSEGFKEYYYLERSSSSTGDDETIVLLTDERTVFITHDHGKTWDPQLKDSEVVAIYPNRHFNDRVYFVTASEKVYYSKDRGYNIHDFKAAGRPNTRQIQILQFHPTQPEWLIWTGCVDNNLNCQTIAHATTKHGDTWTPLMRSIENCEFVYRKGRPTNEKLIYCTHFPNEGTTGRKELVSSEDFFDTKEVKFNDMLNFATMSEYIIVAAKVGDNSQFLKVDASVDGKTFADAKFPPNLQEQHQQAYTVLDSSTHSIFLHVTVNGVQDEEYGSIIKSNSNGTSYALSVNHVNRNRYGYVDFEKMISLEGVALVNVVTNHEEADNGSAKKLKTYVTHNDGAEWSLISPPETDSDGKKYECYGKSTADCALHLHGYTEREDARDTYASASAVGLLIGVGNVGPNLGRKNEGNTFISRDGGMSWHTAKNGQYMWEYGDQGSIIVIVERKNPTMVVFYSRDEGKTWTEYQFSTSALQIDDITTVPSDMSRNFLLWGKETTGSRRVVTVNLDFTGLTDKECILSQDPDDDKNDYYLWQPEHPKQNDGCLNGHVAQYWRKKVGSDCFNGPRIENLYQIKKNCSCTRQDFECDYNYEPASDGTCTLVPGLPTKAASEQCVETPGLREYHDVTGYRKVPLSTCEDGERLEGQTYPCPGFEDEYREKHGISGVALFFAIAVPVLLAVGVGYWVYTRMDGRFGRIRLGGDGPALNVGASTSGGGQSPWVKYPIAAVSAAAAVVMATPRVVGGVVRAARERFGKRGGGYGRAGAGGLSGVGRGQSPYTTRGSFRRGRNDYSSVAAGDDGELLGDDSDDEV